MIEVGDYTIYNDFVNYPTQFEKNNVLYHYPVNGDRLVIGKFCTDRVRRQVPVQQREPHAGLAGQLHVPALLRGVGAGPGGRRRGVGQQGRHRHRQRRMDRVRSGRHGGREDRRRRGDRGAGGRHTGTSRPTRSWAACRPGMIRPRFDDGRRSRTAAGAAMVGLAGRERSAQTCPASCGANRKLTEE